MSKESIIGDKRLFYKFNVSQRVLLKHVNREMTKKLGVPAIHIAVVFYLMKHDGCLSKDLSQVLFQNKSATTTLVERMIKNGLVSKTNSPTDGRASHIFLTDKGRDIGERARPMVNEFNSELLVDFADSEVEVIHRFLDTIIMKYI